MREEEAAFREAARAGGAALCVLDIPLLFETGGESRVDRTIVVTASAPTQRARVLARPGMTAERFEAILRAQVPDAEKRRRADIVLDTEAGLDATHAAIRQLVAELNGG